MATFVPAIDFTGYPDGKTAVAFRKGQESIPVPEAYAQLMREKGLVDLSARRSPVAIPAPPVAVAKKIAAATKRRPGKRRQSSQD